MARIIILLEDLPNGGVAVRVTPNVQTMIEQTQGSRSLTSAETYAIRMARVALDLSREAREAAASQSTIILPSDFKRRD